MDIVATFIRDHEELRRRLADVSGDNGLSVAERRERLFPQTRAALLAHEEAEEGVFSERLVTRPLETGLIALVRDEHGEIFGSLERLSSAELADSEWEDQLDDLRVLVESHFLREEREVFPRMALPDKAEDPFGFSNASRLKAGAGTPNLGGVPRPFDG